MLLHSKITKMTDATAHPLSTKTNYSNKNQRMILLVFTVINCIAHLTYHLCMFSGVAKFPAGAAEYNSATRL